MNTLAIRSEEPPAADADLAAILTELRKLRRQVARLARQQQQRPSADIILARTLRDVVRQRIETPAPETETRDRPPAQPPVTRRSRDSAPAEVPPRPAELVGIYDRLVRHAPAYRDGPIAVKKLIKATPHPVNGWSRGCVTHLCAWGDLFRWPGYQGVSLPPEGAEGGDE